MDIGLFLPWYYISGIFKIYVIWKNIKLSRIVNQN